MVANWTISELEDGDDDDEDDEVAIAVLELDEYDLLRCGLLH